MCRAFIDKHYEAAHSFDWIIYYTMRQIIVAPLVLQSIYDIEMTKQEKTSIVAANPSSLYADGTKIAAPMENYCDMIFAMRPSVFVDYIHSMTPEELATKKLSSEKNLYNFVKEQKLKFGVETIERKRLGVLRYDYAIKKTEIS